MEFLEVEAVQNAILLSESELHNRPLKVVILPLAVEIVLVYANYILNFLQGLVLRFSRFTCERILSFVWNLISGMIPVHVRRSHQREQMYLE